MKTVLCCCLLTFACAAQNNPFLKSSFNFRLVTLPVYYFPFYNDVQIITVDYYTHSLELGALEDQMYPRGGSSFHDAMGFNIPNGYLLRNRAGEILANYGVSNTEQLHLSHPDSCLTITHLEYLSGFRYNHYPVELRKDQFGYAYQIQQPDSLKQGLPLSSLSFPDFHQPTGLMDTLGKVVIPIENNSVTYTQGDYLVVRLSEQFSSGNTPLTDKVDSEQSPGKTILHYAIYDSTFQLTFSETTIPLRPIAKNCYAQIESERVTFMDRYGRRIHTNNYLSIYESGINDLIICSVKRNDTTFYGLLSRELKELTPPVFLGIQPEQYGFKVWDHGRRIGYLNRYGVQIVPFEPEVKSITYRSDHYLEFTHPVAVPNGAMLCKGLIDSSGNTVLPAEYWEINLFHHNLTGVQKNRKWGIVNKRGEVVAPMIYDQIRLHPNFIEVKMGEGSGMLDYSGKMLLETYYSYLFWVDSVIHCGTADGRHFIYDLRSGEKISHEYGRLSPLGNGLLRFHSGKMFGLVNDRAELILPAQFDRINELRNDSILVEKNSKYGLLNAQGKIIELPTYDDFSYDHAGNYVLK